MDMQRHPHTIVWLASRLGSRIHAVHSPGHKDALAECKQHKWRPYVCLPNNVGGSPILGGGYSDEALYPQVASEQLAKQWLR